MPDAEGVSCTTSTASSERLVATPSDFVTALNDVNVTRLVLTVLSLTIDDVHFESVATPILLRRNVTVTGSDSLPDIPILVLNARRKAKLARFGSMGAWLSIVRVALLIPAEDNLTRAPHLGILVYSDPPTQAPTTAASLPGVEVRDGAIFTPACYPMSYRAGNMAGLASLISQQQAAGQLPREYPPRITNRLNASASAGGGCVAEDGGSSNSSLLASLQRPTRPLLQRCWPDTLYFGTMLTWGLEIGATGNPEVARYLVLLANVSSPCLRLADDACIASYQPIGCYSLQLATVPPAPIAVIQPPAPPPGEDGGGGDGDGDDSTTGIIVGCVVGGVAAIAIALGAVWYVRRRRAAARRVGDGGAAAKYKTGLRGASVDEETGSNTAVLLASGDSGALAGTGAAAAPLTQTLLSSADDSPAGHLASNGGPNGNGCAAPVAVDSRTHHMQQQQQQQHTPPGAAAAADSGAAGAIPSGGDKGPILPTTPYRPDLNFNVVMVKDAAASPRAGRASAPGKAAAPAAAPPPPAASADAAAGEARGQAAAAGAAVVAAAVAGAAAVPSAGQAAEQAVVGGAQAQVQAAAPAGDSGDAAAAVGAAAAAAGSQGAAAGSPAAAGGSAGGQPLDPQQQQEGQQEQGKEEGKEEGMRSSLNRLGVSAITHILLPAEPAAATAGGGGAKLPTASISWATSAAAASHAATSLPSSDMISGDQSSAAVNAREEYERALAAAAAGGGSEAGGGGAHGSSSPLTEADTLVLLPVVRGRGAFGRVVEGLYRGRRVAVKMLLGPGDGAAVSCQTALVDAFMQEVEILGRLDHPHIVRLLAVCMDPRQHCLVMELCDTSLASLTFTARGLPGGGGRAGGGSPGPGPAVMPLGKVLHIAIQICSALAALHPTVVHRDLKPANVLINNPDSDEPIAKVTDFGLSRLRAMTLPTQDPEAGTASFLAPECYDTSVTTVTHHADMYSFGVLLWCMLTGQEPWKDYSVVAIATKVCVRGERLPLDANTLPPRRCPNKLQRLLVRLWDRDPLRRPAAEEAAKELMLVREALQTEQQRASSTGLAGSGRLSLSSPRPSSGQAALQLP
ncbi:hypothetical protein HXX76_008492 [Chlamydomonas incerta]|uniref:Protein kinase domain-containing protein n=1 Tax=Chlamydomonas incerta TaxID=51695 RepID=A0A835VZA7_CHLIN|nr:hypothetical protein HXX76_008492 [Chlamydomonas incerta]|eukprot:KAG2433435.1 hypothetical protein HXX76_008492 [Chlamydomonas incerta]